jgi:hypothetical protein
MAADAVSFGYGRAAERGSQGTFWDCFRLKSVSITEARRAAK